MNVRIKDIQSQQQELIFIHNKNNHLTSSIIKKNKDQKQIKQINRFFNCKNIIIIIFFLTILFNLKSYLFSSQNSPQKFLEPQIFENQQIKQKINYTQTKDRIQNIKSYKNIDNNDNFNIDTKDQSIKSEDMKQIQDLKQKQSRIFIFNQTKNQKSQPESSKDKLQSQVKPKQNKIFWSGIWKKSEENRNIRPKAGILISQLEAAKRWAHIRQQKIDVQSQLSIQQRSYYQNKYNISKYRQLPFCIVVPTYNNIEKDRYFYNINSILRQDYLNFHIVIIDDHSNDNTGQKIKQVLEKQKKVQKQRYTLIINEVQKKAMQNIRTAAKKYCRKQQIFIIIDGDDQLIGKQVLKLLNSVYQQKKPWFLYTNFISTRQDIGYSRIFPNITKNNNNYRKYPFVTSHLRSFYTQLFLNVKDQDLQDNQGNYYLAANDVAICIPILQQAHLNVLYLPELVYYYNSNTGQNNHKIRFAVQKMNDKLIRKKSPYKQLQKLQFSIEQRLNIKAKNVINF